MSEATIDDDIDVLEGFAADASPPADPREKALQALRVTAIVRGVLAASAARREESLRVVGAALALGELADTHALGGLAAGDVALTMAKMLALCMSCTTRPSLAVLAFDRDERWFDISMHFCQTCFTGNAVRLHDHVTGRSTAATGNRHQLSAADVARTNRLVQQGTVRLLQIGSGMLKCALQGHTASVRAVAYSPDGGTIATGGADTTVRLWDVASGECRGMLDGHTYVVNTVAYSPDGKKFVTGSNDCTVRLWDAASGTSLEVLAGHTATVTSVAFSPDGATIASGSWDGTVRLWDATSGDCRTVLRDPQSNEDCKVTRLAFSADGATIAAVTKMYFFNTFRLWTVSTGKFRPAMPVKSQILIRAIAFSPDGTTVAAGLSDQTLRLLNVASEESRVLRGHADDVTAVAYSPDGTTVATGSADKTVRLWDVASGECRAVLQGAGSVINGLAYSPDGTTIAACCADKTVRLFNAEYGLSLP